LQLEEELSGIVGRKVDLMSQRAIERSSNWIRRKAILECAEPYFGARSACGGGSPSPKIGDDLRNMAKLGRASSVGEAVDRAVEVARRLDNRVTLEQQIPAYFNGLTSTAAAEETSLEDVLSAATQEIDFDQP
jgi:hypothetical protein